MTAPQHRLLRQPYQPSQSQPIPQRYGSAQQQQYGSQAFSPRLPGQHSSSPLPPPYYPHQAHDMFKNSGVAGTSPMMGMHPQYFMNGGQRPRGPAPNMPVRSQMYYPPPPPMVQYSNVTAPGQPTHYYAPSQGVPLPAQYQNMVPVTHGQMPQLSQQTMYTQPGYGQFTAPPPGTHPSAMPAVTMQSPMMPPPQMPSTSKREKKMIKIVDPSTNKDITDDILRSKKSDSVSTPPSGRSSVTGTPPTQTGVDLAAKFAAQVAAAAGTGKAPAVGVALVDSSVMSATSSPFIHQEPVVGPSNILAPAADYAPPPYATVLPPQRHQDSGVVEAEDQPTASTSPDQNAAMEMTMEKNGDSAKTKSTDDIQGDQQNSANLQIGSQSDSNVMEQVAESKTGSKETDSAPTKENVVTERVAVTDKTEDKIKQIEPPHENAVAEKNVAEQSNKDCEQAKPVNDDDGGQPSPAKQQIDAIVSEQPQVTESEERSKETDPSDRNENAAAEKVTEDNISRDLAQVNENVINGKSMEHSDVVSEKTKPTDDVKKIDTDLQSPANQQDSDISEQVAESQDKGKGRDTTDSNVNLITEKNMEHSNGDSAPTKPANDIQDQQIKQEHDNHVLDQVEDDKSKVGDTGKDVEENAVSEKNVEKSTGDSANPKSANDIKYLDEDQWSPANQEGRRQYASDFLLQFQFRPTSMEKPKDLPNIDCVLEQPYKKNNGPMEIGRGVSDFIPSFAMPRNGPRDKYNKYNRQGSREPHRPPVRPSRQAIPIIHKKVLSIDKDVSLKTTANAWKPIRQSKLSVEDKETLTIEREMRVILNKVTPSTFKVLMNQIFGLAIDTEKKLRITIDLIFEKAIDEPSFSEAYANMCRQMTPIRVTQEAAPDQTTPPGQVEFRKLLLTKCQKEFERDKSDQEHLQVLKKKMEENTDEELAAQLKEEYTTAEFRDRRRTLGNIRFIGELFKLRMLTEPIMHNCIMTLFRAKGDDHLESLCRLLTTIGKDLDYPKAKTRINQYFEQMSKVIAEKRTSSRVRFMLQDVIDLRANNWVPRAIQTQGPKTISQIHQDAKNEQEMLQLKLATAPTPPSKHNSRGAQNRMGNRGGHDDGWTKVQTPKPTRFDPSKMKLLKANTDETKVTLGPSRGFGGWKSGSAASSLTKTGSSGRYSPSTSMDRTPEGAGRSNTPTSMMNRFSALQGPGSENDYQRRQGGRGSSREGSRSGSRGSMGPPSSNSGVRTPRRDERTSLLETTRKLTSMDKSQDSRQWRSRESSPVVPKPRPSTPQQTEPTNSNDMSLDEEKMNQKSGSIVEEFLDIVDFKEATECIEDLKAPPTLMHRFVFVAHEFTLEKKKTQRDNIGRLMAHLLKRGRLSVKQYIKGLAELLEQATDYEIDIPMVWNYIAEQLAPVFHADNESEISLNVLETLASPLREEDRSGVFVAKIVIEVIQRSSLESFVARWQRSNLSWGKILGKDEQAVTNFLENYQLEALADSKETSQQNENTATVDWQNKPNERYRLEKEMTALLNEGLSNDQIFDWVEKTLSPETAISPDFIRALTISVCKRSLSRDPNDADKMILDEEKISERSILLKKYIDTRPERELQVLYGLQNLMMELEQPRDILRKFFDIFYNEDVVQEQTFFKWEKTDDPKETDGFGVAVASVNMFFTWLRTAEPESD